MKETVFLLLLACTSCNHYVKDTNENDRSSIYHIKIEKPDMSSLSSLYLSEFADSIEYLQLEATQDCFLPYYIGARTFVDDNLLFVYDLFAIYQFDMTTGKFLRQIGRIGQGPGEYVHAYTAIDSIDNKVYVKSPGKATLLMYDYEGKYLGNLSLASKQDSFFATYPDSYDLNRSVDGAFIFLAHFMPAKQALHPYELIMYDYKQKKILHSLPNRMEGEFTRYVHSVNGLRTWATSENAHFYKSFYNDTLYAINREGISPYAVIDLGKRKFPVSFIFSPSVDSDVIGKILINSMYIHGDNVILECFLFKDERLGESEWFICRYNTTTGDLTYHSASILNDIDGGQDQSLFYFKSNMSIIPVVPLDEMNEDQKKLMYTVDKSKLKYPELREKFERMQANRDPDDNPLLMILHMKK